MADMLNPDEIQRYRRQITAFHTLFTDNIDMLPDTAWFLEGVPILDKLDNDAQVMYLRLKKEYEDTKEGTDDSLTFWGPKKG